MSLQRRGLPFPGLGAVAPPPLPSWDKALACLPSYFRDEWRSCIEACVSRVCCVTPTLPPILALALLRDLPVICVVWGQECSDVTVLLLPSLLPAAT
jgi:hypothetical protein